MDLSIFQQINLFVFKWFWLDILGIFFAKYFEYVLIFCLFLFLVFNLKKYQTSRSAPCNRFAIKWRAVISALISAVFARFVIVNLIRWFLPRARPFVENNVNLLLSSPKPAFPSGHAAFYFAIATIVCFYNKKAGILFFIGSFLICLARIFVGIHWPTDILAGAAIGIFSGWLIHKISKKF